MTQKDEATLNETKKVKTHKVSPDIFNSQALRAIAFLYKDPPPADLQCSTLVKPGEMPTGAERGIILWLYDNGYILGDLVENKQPKGRETAGITSVKLSGRCRRILGKPRQTGSEVTWGEFAIANAFGEDEPAAAAQLMQRLLDA